MSYIDYSMSADDMADFYDGIAKTLRLYLEEGKASMLVEYWEQSAKAIRKEVSLARPGDVEDARIERLKEKEL